MNQRPFVAFSILAAASFLAGCLEGPQTPEMDDRVAWDPQQASLPAMPLVLPSGTKLSLAHDEPTNWIAPRLEAVENPACLAYDVPVEPTFTYETEVPAGTKEFRIAVEKTITETCMRFELVDPEGVSMRAPAREAAGEGTQSYTSEAIFEDPLSGTWRTEIYAEGPKVELRLRALASTILPDEPEPDTILLPDLRPAPPWELKLQFQDVYNPDAAQAAFTCSPEETVQNEDMSACLRFSFATANIGDGRFELHYTNVAAPAQPREATQWMYAPNGRHEERPAGDMVFHPAHGHFHWGGAYHITLNRVNTDGSLDESSSAFKRTACMFDYFIGDWTRFNQWPIGSADASNGCWGVPVGDATAPVRAAEWIGLSPGWGDVYWWNLPDNYVKFDGRDGTYLLRFEVDRQDQLLESDETNNVSYALFEVTGVTITMLERGYGTGPEDPGRLIVAEPWIT